MLAPLDHRAATRPQFGTHAARRRLGRRSPSMFQCERLRDVAGKIAEKISGRGVVRPRHRTAEKSACDATGR